MVDIGHIDIFIKFNMATIKIVKDETHAQDTLFRDIDMLFSSTLNDFGVLNRNWTEAKR